MARGRRNYKPITPFVVPMRLLVPTTVMVKGVAKKSFSDPQYSFKFFGSMRTFGGTESTVNDIYSVIDTATIDTWYNPSFKADCRIYLEETGETYEILATPEDIERRHQYMQLRCRKIVGGA